MSSGTAQSILARCLVDADFLDALTSTPAAILADYGLDERTRRDFLNLDLSTVRRLAGFITKVQNNGLWQYFAYTRRLLAHYQLDSAIFSTYTRLHQRQRDLDRRAQTYAFLTFLEREIGNLDRDRAPALSDVMAHERALWELAKLQAPSDLLKSATTPRNGRDKLPGPEDIPRCHGAMKLFAVQFDPLITILALKAGTFDPAKLVPANQYFAYALDSVAGQLRICALGDLDVYVLSFINSRRSIRNIARAIGRASRVKIDVGDLSRFLDAAAAAGLVSFR